MGDKKRDWLRRIEEKEGGRGERKIEVMREGKTDRHTHRQKKK